MKSVTRMHGLRTLALPLAVVSLPTLAWGAAPGVGVVSKVAGHATVTRATAPEPLPLRFKDEIFARDAIRTGADSQVRVLLDGRALVTVGGLSVLAISERAGQPVADLKSGTLTLSVARAGAAEGKPLEVRTPNAVASSRGGVALVEVTRATAQSAGEAAGVATRFSVVSGQIAVAPPSSGGGPWIQVEAGKSLTVAGGRMGEPAALGSDAIAPIGGSAGVPQHAQLPEQVLALEQDKAAALAEALTDAGEPGGGLAGGADGDVPLIPPLLPSETAAVPPPPLFLYTNQTVNIAGDLYLRAALTTTTLSLPLLRAISSTVTIGNELLEVAGTLTSSTTWPFIDLSASTLTARNLAIMPGGRLSLAGRLLASTGGTITITDDTVGVTAGGRLTSTGTASLLSFTGTTVNAGNGAGDQLFVVSGAGSQATLAGSVVAATASALNVRGNAMVEVSNFGTLTDSTASALVGLGGGALQLLAGTPGFLFNSSGTATLSGPLLETNGTDLTGTGDLVRGLGRGRLVSGSAGALVSLTGGTHSIATGASAALFRLSGTSTAFDAESGLVLGTERPIQHGGVFFDASGATVTARRGVAVDRALLDASAPLLQLRANSFLTTSSNAVDATSRAKLTETAPVIALDASRLTLTGGAAVNVSGTSYLKVTGDLLSLSNGSQLRVNSGPLLYASGGSVVSISGGLVGFGGSGGNSVFVSNNLCPCSTIGGIRVALTGGALAANVTISGTPIKNPALGTVTLGTANTAHIRVNGATTRVTVNGL